jgi:hypothetical protein
VFNDGLGNVSQGNAHVFGSFHRGVEIEVLDVQCHKLCFRCGDDAVEEESHCCKVGCFGGDFARIVDAVAADSDADVLILLLLGSVGNNNARVSGSTSWWKLVPADEADVVGASGDRDAGSWQSLSETCPLFYRVGFPKGSVGGLKELSVLDSQASVTMDGRGGHVDAWWVGAGWPAWVGFCVLASAPGAGRCLDAGGRLALGDRTDGDAWNRRGSSAASFCAPFG